MIPSQTVVAAGVIHCVHDRGQDAHDLVVQGPGAWPASPSCTLAVRDDLRPPDARNLQAVLLTVRRHAHIP